MFRGWEKFFYAVVLGACLEGGVVSAHQPEAPRPPEEDGIAAGVSDVVSNAFGNPTETENPKTCSARNFPEDIERFLDTLRDIQTTKRVPEGLSTQERFQTFIRLLSFQNDLETAITEKIKSKHGDHCGLRDQYEKIHKPLILKTQEILVRDLAECLKKNNTAIKLPELLQFQEKIESTLTNALKNSSRDVDVANLYNELLKPEIEKAIDLLTRQLLSPNEPGNKPGLNAQHQMPGGAGGSQPPSPQWNPNPPSTPSTPQNQRVGNPSDLATMDLNNQLANALDNFGHGGETTPYAREILGALTSGKTGEQDRDTSTSILTRPPEEPTKPPEVPTSTAIQPTLGQVPSTTAPVKNGNCPNGKCITPKPNVNVNGIPTHTGSESAPGGASIGQRSVAEGDTRSAGAAQLPVGAKVGVSNAERTPSETKQNNESPLPTSTVKGTTNPHPDDGAAQESSNDQADLPRTEVDENGFLFKSRRLVQRMVGNTMKLIYDKAYEGLKSAYTSASNLFASYGNQGNAENSSFKDLTIEQPMEGNNRNLTSLTPVPASTSTEPNVPELDSAKLKDALQEIALLGLEGIQAVSENTNQALKYLLDPAFELPVNQKIKEFVEDLRKAKNSKKKSSLFKRLKAKLSWLLATNSPGSDKKDTPKLP